METQIGRSIRVAEAAAAGESIITYDPENKQAKNYQQLGPNSGDVRKCARLAYQIL